MSTSRLVRSLVVAAGICAFAGAGPGVRIQGQQQEPPPAPQPQPPPAQAPASETPTFRTDASYVLTDVFVTKDGKPVTDLTLADFELREDGVVQTIRSFERIEHSTEPSAIPRRSPSTVAESNAVAGDPRRRVFVVFLDAFHVDRGASMWAREQLQKFLKTALGPDDLVAYMTPHMSGMDISFSTSTEPLIRYFDDNPVWGVADESPGTETDAVERDLQSCFCCGKELDAIWMGHRSRLREERSLQALHGLVAHLDSIRESRKAVIAVTSGWRLFTENPTKLTDKETAGRVMGTDPIGVGPDGRLGMPDRNRINGVTDSQCDTVRLRSSSANSDQSFRDLIAEANRSSTSFYTIDVQGLRTEMRPMPTTAAGAMIESHNRERRPYSTTLDSIRELGEATNGLAIIDTNDLEGGLRKAAADFNNYYLLGYTSSNSKPDGRYRKIKVNVKRPGVFVRARDGYLARRVDERPPANTSTAPGSGGNTEAALVTAALGKLTPTRPGVPLVLSATAGAVPGGTSRVIRVVAELDAAIAATPEWAEGGEAHAFVRDLKGATITEGKAPLAKGSRTVEIELPVVAGMSGEAKVQMRLQGTGALARYTDTTVVALDALPAGWGAPRLSRRGPSTGIAWVPTADPRFRRQERVRVTVGAPAGAAGPVAGALLDRQGKPINIPVKVEQPEPTALVAELALAPLAVGDYVLALGGGPKRLLVPLRVVP